MSMPEHPQDSTEIGASRGRAIRRWNFADVWEIAAQQVPHAPAQVQGDRRISWSAFDRRANGVAQALLEAGVKQQDKVAQYLYNCPEYLESVYATFKAGLVPVNTNYRYLDDELVYLWNNADVVVVVFHGAFADRIQSIRGRLPDVRLWLWVDDGTSACPAWAARYEDTATAGTSQSVSGPWGRTGDDLLLLYTGGTTGMPKGVMWRQDDLFRASAGTLNPAMREDPDTDLSAIREAVIAPGLISIPACPLMHGTGYLTQLAVLSGGGCTVTLRARSFDIHELLTTIESERAGMIAIVGDAFAKPMLAALDDDPSRWDISSLVLVNSSGVMWSEATKHGLLSHHPEMTLIDSFSSSEALGMGRSVSTAGTTSITASFQLGENAQVIDDDGRVIAPGSGQVGRVAVGGFQPVGYYKDQAKTASTFVTIDGERYSMPGDYATVESDGTLTLLGRGSACINTAGEKVFPEEVEEILKTHPAVGDAVVVGVTDERLGEAVTAIVELAGGQHLDEADLISHVRVKVAAYKVPKRILPIDTIGRAPNGKVDYKHLKAWAVDYLGRPA